MLPMRMMAARAPQVATVNAMRIEPVMRATDGGVLIDLPRLVNPGAMLGWPAEVGQDLRASPRSAMMSR